jgi:hypothetical protein
VKQIHTHHNLECALHVLSGFSEKPNPGETPKPGEDPKTFGASFDRDFALVNKIGDALIPEFGISPNWLDTLTPNVKKSDGGALIQPYDDEEGGGQPSVMERKKKCPTMTERKENCPTMTRRRIRIGRWGKARGKSASRCTRTTSRKKCRRRAKVDVLDMIHVA